MEDRRSSGVLTEGRTAGGRRHEVELHKSDDYEYWAGRQGQSGIPNPDDEEDDESTDSVRSPAGPEPGADDDDDVEPGVAQRRYSGLNGQSRELSENLGQRRVEFVDEETCKPV